MVQVFESYVVDANSLGSFLNTIYEKPGYVKDFSVSSLGVAGSVVVLIKR